MFPNPLCWVVVPMPKPKRRPSEILQWFEEHPNSAMSLRSLSLTLGIPYKTVAAVVYELVKEGKLKRVGRGVYALPSFKSEKS